MFSFFQPIQTQEEIKQELNQKLAAFEVAMKNKDLDRVLSFFEKDGAYGQVKGRQEIKRVLKSYFNNEIISYTMRTDKITIKKSNGVFRIIWHQVNGNWAIQYLDIAQDNSY